MDALSGRGELRAALGLAEAEGLGPRRIRALVDRWGSARAALAAADRVEPRPGLSAKAVASLRRARPAAPDRLDRLAERGIRLVAYGGRGYPDRLGHLDAPPPLLWLQGPGELPSERAVTVVGTRKATGYGRRVARDLGAGLAAVGLPVVSGMAAGVDGAAHRGALDAGGATVGVLGSGLDHEYPAAHRDLYRRMRSDGLLASEHPPDEPPRAAWFPRRNRILAALAEAVVVVQAPEGSGALITADLALDLGREVMAVPGPVGPAASIGPHRLLRDGAAPATSAHDVLRAVDGPEHEGEGDVPTLPGPDRLAALLGRDAGDARSLCRPLLEGPRDGDDLAREAGLPAGAALALLSRLELEGAVRSLPGGRWELAPDDGR